MNNKEFIAKNVFVTADQNGDMLKVLLLLMFHSDMNDASFIQWYSCSNSEKK